MGQLDVGKQNLEDCHQRFGKQNLERRHPEPGFSRVKDPARGGRRSGSPYTTVDLTPGVGPCSLSESRRRPALLAFCAKGQALYRLPKDSAFGWRSASSAAVNALESAKVVAAEVHRTKFFSKPLSSHPRRLGQTPNRSRRHAASDIQSPPVGKNFKPELPGT